MSFNKSVLYLKQLADNNKDFYGFVVQYSPDLSKFVFHRDHTIACVDSCDISNLFDLYAALNN